MGGALHRRSVERIAKRHAARSRCRHTEDTGLRSYCAVVVNGHNGHYNFQAVSFAVTTTADVPNSTSPTVIPVRRRRRLNAVVTRTGFASLDRFASQLRT